MTNFELITKNAHTVANWLSEIGCKMCPAWYYCKKHDEDKSCPQTIYEWLCEEGKKPEDVHKALEKEVKKTNFDLITKNVHTVAKWLSEIGCTMCPAWYYCKEHDDTSSGCQQTIYEWLCEEGQEPEEDSDTFPW